MPKPHISELLVTNCYPNSGQVIEMLNCLGKHIEELEACISLQQNTIDELKGRIGQLEQRKRGIFG